MGTRRRGQQRHALCDDRVAVRRYHEALGRSRFPLRRCHFRLADVAPGLKTPLWAHCVPLSTEAALHKDTIEDTTPESFGETMRRLRGQLSLRGLERRSGWNYSYLGQIERGEKPGTLQVAEDCDLALEAGGALVAKFKQAPEHAQDTPGHGIALGDGSWIHTLESGPGNGKEGVIDRRGFLGGVLASALIAPILPHHLTPAHTEAQALAIAGPPGDWFPGVATPAIAFPADTVGKSVMVDPRGLAALSWPGGSRRLLIGADAEGHRYVLDASIAAARHRQGMADAPVRIPQSLLLDEVTESLLWALTNIESSLHADDAVIDQASAAGTGAWDLTPVTHAWIGSSACANHLLTNLHRIDTAPDFWTRERTAEEASTWMFFSHKVKYLEETQRRYGSAAEPASRTFCIPESTFANATLQERIILLLAMALMESFTVTTRICTHPEYAATDGFAASASTAIIATWVRASQQVTMDVVSSRSAMGDFDDAIRHTSTCNAAPGANPAERLEAAADYLGVEWARFTSRCAELSGTVLDALLVSRSRHLTTAGPKRACTYLTQLTHTHH
jgi:hypothetical protein